MPSTIAIITGLTYGATDLQDFPRVFLEITSGGPDWTPEVRGQDRTVPYRDGQVYAPRRAHRLPITLDGWVEGEGTTEADQRADTAVARQELRTLFDPTAGPATLTCTTEDGTSWTIEAIPTGLVWDARPPVPTHWGVSVSLVAIDTPYWTASGS